MSAYDDSDHFAWNPHATPDDPPRDATPSTPNAAPAHTRQLDLAQLADALPKLGTVLWLERRAPRASGERPASGPRGVVLLDHPALVVLGHCTTAVAHTAVTPVGPREWLCFGNRDGEPQAKLFLLPDTDYLAWDEMTAACRLTSTTAPVRWNAHGAFLRSAIARLGSTWRARLLTFELRRLPWLRTLDARAPLRISLLGLELARTIVRDEAAELVSPLHSA